MLIAEEVTIEEDTFMLPPINGYTFIEKIGEGGFAEVYKATRNSDGAVVAIKVTDKSTLNMRQDRMHFQKEIDTMSILRHPNIVSLLDFFMDENKFYVVLEYCNGGDLYDYLREKTRLTEQQAATVMTQLVEALQYAHSFKVAHRDLKLENILVDGFPKVKITDFGLCGYVDENHLMKTFCGSPSYCAPECIMHVEYDGRLSDIWSLGIILFCLVTGCHPWNQGNKVEMARQIMEAKIVVPPFISTSCADLITSMIRYDPLERLSLDQIAKHPWMRKAVPVVKKMSLKPLRESDAESPISLSELSASMVRRRPIDKGIYAPISHSAVIQLASAESGDHKEEASIMPPLLMNLKKRHTHQLARTVLTFPQVKESGLPRISNKILRPTVKMYK